MDHLVGLKVPGGIKGWKTLGGSSDGIKGQKIIGGSSGGFNGHK